MKNKDFSSYFSSTRSGEARDLNNYIINDVESKSKKVVRCGFIYKETGRQCITILNEDNVNRGCKYCSLHQWEVNQ
jgi:hypothetical protein